MLVCVLLGVFIVTTAIFAYIAYINYIKFNKALKYAEAYVLFVSNLWYRFNDTKNKMDEIDRIGAFRTDDQVGHTFTALQECIDDLYGFITKYVNKEEAKK